MSKRILVVEDDGALMTILEAALSYGGFTAIGAGTGRAALELFTSQSFGGVLLDIGLPDMTGERLLKEMRRLSDLPIIVVSGHDTEQDRVRMLDLGADDFVGKPFLPGELLARLRAARRRALPLRKREREERASTVRFGGFELDPLTSGLNFQDRSVNLTPAEYAIMRALMTQRAGPLSEEDIMRELYDDHPRPQSRISKVYITRLRSKLRELGADGEMIVNRRGQGWVLIAPD